MIMKMEKIVILLALISFNGCAFFKAVKGGQESSAGPTTLYELNDTSGRFILKRDSFVNKKDNTSIVKRKVYLPENSKKELEKSVAISDIGSLDKKVQILRPRRSQYIVWLEGKKYQTDMTLDQKSRSLIVKMLSPESKWNGTQKVPFPKGTGVYCFFSQLVECISRTGFFEMATNKNAGEINFHIIWDGYPYFQEQYSDIPNEVFTRAQAGFEGKTEGGERRITIMFEGQSIFLNINENEGFSKLFWVSQGLTISPINQESSEDSPQIKKITKKSNAKKLPIGDNGDDQETEQDELFE